ncbi:hypothetical protein Tco_1529340, partial [Tanacetum coccineum]
MKSYPSIYRGGVKRGKGFQNDPSNHSPSIFLNDCEPFDGFDEVLWPIGCCHVLVVD